MALSDTGFLVGGISKDDQHHRRCMEIAATLPPFQVTTWPCVTEAMHLLRFPVAQEKLRRQIETGILRLYEPDYADGLRACALMRKYADAPMDFADASLVVAAERLNITCILTFDRHFYAYRINDNTSFEVLP